jgi:hypothetical protein
MYSVNLAKIARRGRTALRTLAAFALLSSPWIAAHAKPTLSGTPAPSVVVAHYYSFQPGVALTPGKAVLFGILNKPYWAQFDSTTGRLTGTPYPAAAGTFSNIVIGVRDSTGIAVLGPFSITVKALPATPPTISGTPAGTVTVAQTYNFQPRASDPNGLQMAFAINSKPSWASFDSKTGRLTGTPAASNAGTYSNIIITVYDGYMKAVLPTFSIVVQPLTGTTAPPPPPPPPPATGSATVSWTPPSQNTDGSQLGNLSGYHIYYGAAAGNLTQSVAIANPGLTRYVLNGLSTQTWYFSMTSYNSAGVESGRSAVQSFTVH